MAMPVGRGDCCIRGMITKDGGVTQKQTLIKWRTGPGVQPAAEERQLGLSLFAELLLYSMLGTECPTQKQKYPENHSEEGRPGSWWKTVAPRTIS